MIRFNVHKSVDMTDRLPEDTVTSRLVVRATVASITKTLTPQAERALEEAALRRGEIETRVAGLPPERGGRGGTEPVRYGDWEVKGLATDF